MNRVKNDTLLVSFLFTLPAKNTTTCVNNYLCQQLLVSTNTCVNQYLCQPILVSTNTCVNQYLCQPILVSTTTCLNNYLLLSARFHIKTFVMWLSKFVWTHSRDEWDSSGCDSSLLVNIDSICISCKE